MPPEGVLAIETPATALAKVLSLAVLFHVPIEVVLACKGLLANATRVDATCLRGCATGRVAFRASREVE